VIFGALQVTKVLSTVEVKRVIEGSGKDFGKSSFSHANLISGPNLELGPELQVTLMQQVKFRSRFCLHFFSLLIRMHNASLHEFVNKHLAIIWGHFRALLQAVFCREIELCCS
jgi:hypothetical protein